LLAEYGRARKWTFHARDFHLISRLKTIRPGLPRSDLYGARRTSGRAAIKFHIVMMPAAVKLREAVSEILAPAAILKREFPVGQTSNAYDRDHFFRGFALRFH
jgi:hypothetical protein